MTLWSKLAGFFGAETREHKPDLRNGLPRVAVPDEHEHLPGEVTPSPGGPRIVAPDYHVQSPGDATRG